MQAHTFETQYFIFETVEELQKLDQKILQAAKASLGHAYAPYSNFQVGAAALLENGETIQGWNIENASYPLCLCAERTALAAADSQFPGQIITTLAITVYNPEQIIDKPASPCGACRQVICELERRQGHPIRLVLQGETGAIFVFQSGLNLLPFSFDETYL